LYIDGYTVRLTSESSSRSRLRVFQSILFPIPYSQTLENRSSLVENPAAGLTCVFAAGAALLQPPKSSSALTLGGALLAGVKPPPPPGTMLWPARLLEPQPKSPLLVCGRGGLAIGGLVCAVLQASFDPQASVLPQAPLIAGAGCFEGGAGWERLKTDDGAMVGEATICFAGTEGAGEEKSNKSAIPELVFVAFDKGAGDIPGAESKAPNPLEVLNPRDGCSG